MADYNISKDVHFLIFIFLMKFYILPLQILSAVKCLGVVVYQLQVSGTLSKLTETNKHLN